MATVVGAGDRRHPAAAVPSLHEDVVTGTPTANHAAVVQAAADRKIQAEADQRAADAAVSPRPGTSGEAEHAGHTSTTPANTNGYSISVLDVALIQVAN